MKWKCRVREGINYSVLGDRCDSVAIDLMSALIELLLWFEQLFDALSWLMPASPAIQQQRPIRCRRPTMTWSLKALDK